MNQAVRGQLGSLGEETRLPQGRKGWRCPSEEVPVMLVVTWVAWLHETGFFFNWSLVPSFFFFFSFFYFFLAAPSLRCCLWAFSNCSERGYLSWSAWASHCSGVSCCEARVLGVRAFSSVSAYELSSSHVGLSGFRDCSSRDPERRRNSSGTLALLPCGR